MKNTEGNYKGIFNMTDLQQKQKLHSYNGAGTNVLPLQKNWQNRKIAISNQFFINNTLLLWFTKLALQLTVTFVSCAHSRWVCMWEKEKKSSLVFRCAEHEGAGIQNASVWSGCLNSEWSYIHRTEAMSAHTHTPTHTHRCLRHLFSHLLFQKQKTHIFIFVAQDKIKTGHKM